jgi:thymidylate synthase
MNLIDTEYQDLLCYILGNGVEKKDRTGTGTLSIFGWQIRHNMKDGFPLLTTKKMHWKSIVTELLWFLRGDTNIKYLVDNGCHIWDGDCYRAYCNTYPDVEKTFQYEGSNIEVRKMTKDEFIEKIKTDDEFANKWGELGPIYGKQWRDWKSYDHAEAYFGIGIDQIANLISELKTNPDSRRLMVNAWNVGELDQMVLPPCHYGFQVYTRELSQSERTFWIMSNRPEQLGSQNYLDGDRKGMKSTDYDGVPTRAISLMWNQRSLDTFLGLPFNIASYGLLLEIIAKEVNMVPDELIGSLGDCHLYLSDHIEAAKEQIGREPFELPTLEIHSSKIDDIAHHEITDFEIKNYQSHPKINATLSN